MRILLLSPYHGGSHRAWVEGYRGQSVHDIHVLSLPAQFWKWRMRGGSIALGRQFIEESENGRPLPDLILATDLMDSAAFLAQTRHYTAGIPLVLYMHENQLTYPPSPRAKKGKGPSHLAENQRQYALTNVVSMLAAKHTFFNSRYHQALFFEALPELLAYHPDYQELEIVELLQSRISVLPVGIDFARIDSLSPDQPTSLEPPLILWNQRWDHDKNPERFLRVLGELAGEGLDFRLALAGERFGKQTPKLTGPAAELASRIIHNGFADDAHYGQLLWEAEITISVARHEYFGISILEAAHANTLPILPNRLSYPEVIPAGFHEACFYGNATQLKERIRWAVEHRNEARLIARQLSREIGHFDWRAMAPRYDSLLLELADGGLE